MTEHVFLVAVTVEGKTREIAEGVMTVLLPQPGSVITSWWVAEDDARDGNDCDSAIFVPRGSQPDMRAVISQYCAESTDMWTEYGYPYAGTDVSGVWFSEAGA